MTFNHAADFLSTVTYFATAAYRKTELMLIIGSTLVIGHRNPDMDAIASAVGYAWLLNQAHPGLYLAARAGEVNPQTAYALQKFGIEAPLLVSNVRPRVGDVAENIPPLYQGQTVLEACQLIAQTKRPVALVDNGRPFGMISGESLFAILAEALTSGSTEAINAALAAPFSQKQSNPTLSMHTQEYIRDVINSVLHSEADDFAVMDENDRYAGICRKSALLTPPRQQVILVDHNEAQQAVAGIDEAEIIEVLDHHRIGSMTTVLPIRFQIEPVGSCSTLVSESAFEQGYTFPPGIAGLLLCGILSDTLTFRSPTTTSRDEAAARRLAKIAELAPSDASSEAVLAEVQAFGKVLLSSGAGLGSRKTEDIVSSDIKFYTINGLNIAIAQAEVTDFSEFDALQRPLYDNLQANAEAQKLHLALLMVTDILLGSSRLIVVAPERLISALPYRRLSAYVLDAPGVVSRKKQLLPAITAALA